LKKSEKLLLVFGIALFIVCALYFVPSPLPKKYVLRFSFFAEEPDKFDPNFLELNGDLTVYNVGSNNIHNVYLEYERYGTNSGFRPESTFKQNIYLGDIPAGKSKIVFFEKYRIFVRYGYNYYTETWSVYNDMSFTIRADEGYVYIKDNDNNQAFNKAWTLK